GEKLGVIVVSSRDVSNAVSDRIATIALRLMLAAKAGKPLPKVARSEPLSAEEARKLAGRYRSRDGWYDLIESFGRLYLLPDRGGALLRLRKSGESLITDDVQDWGLLIGPDRDEITIGTITSTREKTPGTAPPAPPEKWLGLIGEYGWDHN